MTMATKPKAIRWKRSGHTEAKHKILTNYLAAWIPILAQVAGMEHLILIDGFAGPGRYEGNEKGSPLLMLDAYARRGDRAKLGVTVHYFFIEQDADRAAALDDELGKRNPSPDIEPTVVPGSYDVEFPKVLTEIDNRFPKEKRAIFTFIDPFGAEQNKLELTRQLLDLPKCEALVFVPLSHFSRFISQADTEATMQSLFGTDEWKQARELSTLAERNGLLSDLFRKQLKQSCRWVRAFEIVPADGRNSHFLFFGTNSRKGLERMKESMWKLDPIKGQTFRDSTLADHPVLFSPKGEVDTTPLLEAMKEHFGTKPFTIEEAVDFALYETPYLPSHVKKRTLVPAETRGELKPVDQKPGRKARTYPPGTRISFVAPAGTD
jgi:three-Cys-motif partner protein